MGTAKGPWEPARGFWELQKAPGRRDGPFGVLGDSTRDECPAENRTGIQGNDRQIHIIYREPLDRQEQAETETDRKNQTERERDRERERELKSLEFMGLEKTVFG